MEHVFEQAKDLHVKSVIFYANPTDGKLYEDASFLIQAAESDAFDLFKKGLLVVNINGINYVPVCMNGKLVRTICKTGGIAAEFSDTKTYALNDYVQYSGEQYKCKTAISVAAPWDSSKWDKVETLDFISFQVK